MAAGKQMKLDGIMTCSMISVQLNQRSLAIDLYPNATRVSMFSSLCPSLQILTMDEVSKIGKISKQWTGLLREAFTDSDNFGIQFPMDLDVKMKAVMIGACFLIVSSGCYRRSSLTWPSFHREWCVYPHWLSEISYLPLNLPLRPHFCWQLWPECKTVCHIC